jgi:hypothetical protein
LSFTSSSPPQPHKAGVCGSTVTQER